MTYFDATLEAEPIAEQNTDPILPEDRFIFELVGFERSGVDQWHKNGGIKWTFAVYDLDGRPFEFQNEPYMLWRTTNVNAQGKPLFTLGTQAHEWASALLGRTLGVDEQFSVSELRNKRFSSQVVWQPKKTKPKEKAAVLASLRHIPLGARSIPTNGHSPATSARPAAADASVSADASDDDIDRALVVTMIRKSLKRLKALDADAGAKAQAAVEASDLDEAALDDLHALSEQISTAVRKAIED